jgi:hypothetical protein
MSNAEASSSLELVVANDGSIHADQLAQLGIRPGTRLCVVQQEPNTAQGTLRGLLPDLPDLTWEDFEAASKCAQVDIAASVNRK